MYKLVSSPYDASKSTQQLERELELPYLKWHSRNIYLKAYFAILLRCSPTIVETISTLTNTLDYNVELLRNLLNPAWREEPKTIRSVNESEEMEDYQPIFFQNDLFLLAIDKSEEGNLIFRADFQSSCLHYRLSLSEEYPTYTEGLIIIDSWLERKLKIVQGWRWLCLELERQGRLSRRFKTHSEQPWKVYIYDFAMLAFVTPSTSRFLLACNGSYVQLYCIRKQSYVYGRGFECHWVRNVPIDMVNLKKLFKALKAAMRPKGYVKVPDFGPIIRDYNELILIKQGLVTLEIVME